MCDLNRNKMKSYRPKISHVASSFDLVCPICNILCFFSSSPSCCLGLFLAPLSVSRLCRVADRMINEYGATGGIRMIGETYVFGKKPVR
jgi:hypothetical protein